MNSTIIHSLLCPKSATVISEICTGQVDILHRFGPSFEVEDAHNNKKSQKMTINENDEKRQNMKMTKSSGQTNTKNKSRKTNDQNKT